MPNVVKPDGSVVFVPDDALGRAIEMGYQLESPEAELSRTSREGALEQYKGIGGAIKAGIQGGLRGATVGLSDVFQRATGTEAEELRLLKEANPTVSTVSEVAGAVVPTLLSGGTGAVGTAARLTPAGATSRLALGVTERVAGQAPSAARYV